jgi:hypothetical protein
MFNVNLTPVEERKARSNTTHTLKKVIAVRSVAWVRFFSCNSVLQKITMLHTLPHALFIHRVHYHRVSFNPFQSANKLLQTDTVGLGLRLKSKLDFLYLKKSMFNFVSIKC